MHDYVIVGAGSAGCVLANRLSKDPGTSVLLLEAGRRDNQKEIHIPAGLAKVLRTDRDWGYETEPQARMNGRRMYWPRGKTLGGSSSVNAMIYMRGNPADYDEWAKAGNHGWAYDEVLPYFLRSEDNSRGASAYHGAGGPLAVSDLRDPNPLTKALVDAAVQFGMPRKRDFNAGDQDGAGFFQVTQRAGRRCSTAVAFLRPVRRRPNLTVQTDAHTRRVVIEDGRARGVEYVHDGRERTATARKEVILAGGAVNSPQLLMLSGVGPADHLRDHGVEVVADLAGVGRNLQDHLCVAMMLAVTEPLSLLTAEKPAELVKFLVRRKGKLTSNIGEAGAFVRIDPEATAPDVQYHFAPVYFDTNLEEEPAEHALTIGPTLLQPRSVGHLQLRSADPLEHPAIEPAYLSDAEGADLATLVAGVRLAREILGQPALDRLRGVELHPGDDVQTDEEIAEFVRRRGSTLYHPVGTAKMGVDDDSVVDPELRVRGIESLRVVDASVMPRVPRGNTNAPTIMIAEKAADLVLAAG